MQNKLTKVGRPSVSEKKKQVSRTIKFDTEEEAYAFFEDFRLFQIIED